MNLQDYRKIANALNADLTAVFEKHGFKVAQIRASVGIESKVSVTIIQNGEDPDAARWTSQAEWFGMKPEWLGKTVHLGGRPHVIAGLKGGRGEKSVILTRDGKRYVITPQSLKVAVAGGLS